jgi:hypothetical protein
MTAMKIPKNVKFKFAPPYQVRDMNLRQYFAAHAPERPMSWFPEGWEAFKKRTTVEEQAIHLTVEWRWHYAEAMLAGQERAR